MGLRDFYHILTLLPPGASVFSQTRVLFLFLFFPKYLPWQNFIIADKKKTNFIRIARLRITVLHVHVTKLHSISCVNHEALSN